MSTVMRYSNPVNTLFNDIFNGIYREQPTRKSFRPQIDIVESETDFKLFADLPGFSKKDVTLSVENDVLTISGEKKHQEAEDNYYRYYERRDGAFERKFNLPEEVDSDSVTAEMKNGELIVSIRKVVNVVPKKVNIAVE